MNRNQPVARQDPTSWDLLLACLSVYVLAALSATLLFHLPAEVDQVLHLADTAICCVFLADFFLRFATAPDRLKFLKWGWIDLLASIPSLDALRWGRVVSVTRVFMLLRFVRSWRVLSRVLRHDPALAFVTMTLMATVMIMVICSILVLSFETTEKSNIKTGYDALWWSLTTVTTVGYGDFFPVTPKGRMVGGVLMIFGIALYATFTAFISARIMEVKQHHEEEEVDATHAEVKLLREEVQELRRILLQRLASDEKIHHEFQAHLPHLSSKEEPPSPV